MICLYIELNNYGGIYNGLHLNSIYIDFRKCKHQVILLKGDSGSGKSTIIESISPLPESNEYFIPEMAASKKIGYLDEATGISYDITYVHDVKPNGDRTTAKGYILKRYPDGNTQELNPTGNITPCKEMIYSEFELDPNFIALTKMNTTDKGLVDKTPSARKIYVNSILSTTQAYNEMYKKINKKVSAYKDRIKRITTKIDSIGNPEKIRLQLDAVDKRKTEVTARIERLTDAIARADSTMSSIDANGTVSTRYSDIKTRLTQIEKMTVPLKRYIETKESKDSYNETVDILNQAIPNMNMELSGLNIKTDSLLKDREYDSKSLEEKLAKLDSCTDSTMESFNDEYNRIQSLFDSTTVEINELGFSNIINCSPEKFDKVVSICKELQALFHSEIPQEIVGYLMSDVTAPVFTQMQNSLSTFGKISIPDMSFEFGSMIPKNLVSCTKEAASEKTLAQVEAEYSQYEALLNTAKLLQKRPTTCTDETCPFIKNAVIAQKEIDFRNYTPEQYKAEIEEWRAMSTMLDLHLKSKKHCNTFFTTIAKKFNEAMECSDILNMIGIISNDTIFNCCQSIFMNNPRYDMTNIFRAKQGVDNIFTLRKAYSDQLSSLDSQKQEYLNKNALYNEISEDIARLQNKISETMTELSQIDEKREDLISKINVANLKLEEAKECLAKYDELENLSSEYSKLTEDKSKIEDDAIKYNQAVDFIQKASSEKVTLNSELENLDLQRSELNYNSRMIATYNEELNTIHAEYKYIELIKYYTSPSSTGIQTVFAAMYMNDIVIQANQILSGLFNGELTIMPFIIDESEFRIPIARLNGIPLDDVKSLSGGQTALVSMIISFALVHKSSSKLNILTADELDGPLDPALRRQFIDTLYTVLRMVGSSQAILISHNSEMPMSECDIVLLKNDNADGPNVGGNVIWSYYNQG